MESINHRHVCIANILDTLYSLLARNNIYIYIKLTADISIFRSIRILIFNIYVHIFFVFLIFFFIYTDIYLYVVY